MATKQANWKRLREARKRLGLSQGELAAAQGLRQQAIHRRELPDTHRDHVPMSEGECDIWIGHAKEIVRKWSDELAPAEVLGA